MKVNVFEVLSMATPRLIDTSKKYYHGTPKESSAKSIFNEGLDPAVTEIKYGTRKSPMRPMQNHVYLAQNLGYAIAYAISEDYAGRECPQYVLDQYGDFGFVFEFEGTALKDISPDEDSVGEFIYRWLNKDSTEFKTKYKAWFMQEGITACMTELLDVSSKHLTENQLDKIKGGAVSFWAKCGKKLMPLLSDSLKLNLLDYGAHCAHNGKIKPSKCFKFNRADTIHIKRDGSNFLEYATPYKP